MESSNKKLKPEVRNMKLATVLAATASVSSYIAENWWNEAVNVFDFANSNWDQFAAAANYVGMSENTQGFLYNFGAKYWNVVDQDNSGSLNYDEYKYTMAGFAAIDARVILGAFDSDSNGILTGAELTELK